MRVLCISLIAIFVASCTPVPEVDNPIVVPVGTSTATVPPPPPTETPPPPLSASFSADDPVLVGAGDIVDCSGEGDEETAALLKNIPGTVFTTGDNVYPGGDYTDFMNCYDGSWGRQLERTYPAPGNHDYYTAGAMGYFNYFGSAAGDPDKGYYSYDLGTWHIVVLNSEIQVNAGSEQEQWLRADLAANPADCTLAYWHVPRFSSGDVHGSDDRMEPLWQALYDFGADVVLAGHEHNYERFAPQTPQGAADPLRGIRQFVVGTGGYSHYPITNPIANSEVRNTDTFGVLKLVLHPGSYSWEFIPVEGKTFSDSGTALCVTSGSSASSEILVFTPTDDATVKSEAPDENFGAEEALLVDNTPYDNFLLKFNVFGIQNRQVLSAKLRLYTVNQSDSGGDFYPAVNNDWDENTVTWNTAPVASPNLLASLGPVSKDTWYEIDLSSLIVKDGIYTVFVNTVSANGADYASKEGMQGSAPQLIVSVGAKSSP